MDDEDFEQIQDRKIIESLNEQQKLYFIQSKIDLGSKNPVYIAYRRKYRSQIENNDDYCEQYNNYDQLYDIKKRYALKLLKFYTKKQKSIFEREKTVLDIFIEDPEVIKYHEIIPVIMYNRRHILVSMLFYPDVDLLYYLWRPSFKFDENFICLIAYKALKILNVLKMRGVVHNDIKFENFIVSSENPFDIIITDFESAELVNYNGKSRLIAGTSIFKSPEVLRGEEHDYAADMWSLGMNLYYHLFFKYPFGIDDNDLNSKSENIILKKINDSKLIRPDNVDFICVSDSAWSLVSAMLEKESEDRIEVEEALKHDWFSFMESTEIKSATSQYDFDQNFDDEIDN